jgi:hypothetical protein
VLSCCKLTILSHGDERGDGDAATPAALPGHGHLRVLLPLLLGLPLRARVDLAMDDGINFIHPFIRGFFILPA